MERDLKSEAEENPSSNGLEFEFDLNLLKTVLEEFLRGSDVTENLQWSSTQTLPPNWLELPREVTLSILEKLDAFDILENVQRVCTQWESICKDPSLWKTITYKFGSSPSLHSSTFRQAVDRSCGGLVNLHLIDCNSAELLDYVTQRCTQIRSLRLVQGWIFDDGLCEVAKRLPLLEDLELSYNLTSVTAKALLKFGECCPLLKSLKFMNACRFRSECMDDREAMAIAEKMVGLRHLQLFGNLMTNKGLKTILDSCTHLESLDIRKCFSVDLQESSLRNRCTERINDFREPYDTTEDYEFDDIIYYDDIYDVEDDL